MTNSTSKSNLRKLGVLSAVIVLNSFLLYRAFVAPESLVAQESAALVEQAKPNEVKQIPKTEPISIEIVQTPKPVQVEVKKQSQSIAQPVQAAPQKTPSKETSESSEPRLVGKVSMGYFELERMVERSGGAIFLYDINTRRPIRQIKRGVLVSLSQAPEALSAVGHNITDELESHRVSSWAEEQRLFNPSGSFVVVAKFPASFQQGFEQLAHQAASELNIEYKSVDEVRFQFTHHGLVIHQLKVDDAFLAVNKVFST